MEFLSFFKKGMFVIALVPIVSYIQADGPIAREDRGGGGYRGGENRGGENRGGENRGEEGRQNEDWQGHSGSYRGAYNRGANQGENNSGNVYVAPQEPTPNPNTTGDPLYVPY